MKKLRRRKKGKPIRNSLSNKQNLRKCELRENVRSQQSRTSEVIWVQLTGEWTFFLSIISLLKWVKRR